MKNNLNADTFVNIKSALITHSCVEVTFHKKNREIRTMFCTLKKDRIPAEKQPKSVKTSDSSTVLAVYDLDANAWRSFRIDSVIEWEIAE